MPDAAVEIKPIPTIDDETTQIVNTVANHVEELGEDPQSVQPAHSVIPGQEPLVEKMKNQFVSVPIPTETPVENPVTPPVEQTITGDMEDLMNGLKGRVRTAAGSDFLKIKLEDAKKRGMVPEPPNKN